MASAYRAPRRAKGGRHARRIHAHEKHRRSGAHKGLTRRINRALFRGRTVNAPKRIW